MKRAAVATGRGAAWLAATGYEHRHYLPAALNGAVGDRLAAAGHRLAIPTGWRDAGGDVTTEAAAAALAAGGGHAAVMVHGLMADDVCWREPGFGLAGLGPQLERELGLTPLIVRYNSGRHVSEIGRELAQLLEELAVHEPRALERLTLIGHSMGGLVVRSATHYGRALGHTWPARVAAVVLIGVPHDGSWLEQASFFAAGVLKLIANLHTQLIGALIDARSAGIKDLRLGLLVDEDWRDPAAAARFLDERTEVPPLPGVPYHLVAGTLAADHAGHAAHHFGDGLVGRASALSLPLPADPTPWTQEVFTRVAHATMVMRPEVHAHVLACLGVAGQRLTGPHQG